MTGVEGERIGLRIPAESWSARVRLRAVRFGNTTNRQGWFAVVGGLLLVGAGWLVGEGVTLWTANSGPIPEAIRLTGRANPMLLLLTWHRVHWHTIGVSMTLAGLVLVATTLVGIVALHSQTSTLALQPVSTTPRGV